MPTLWRPTFLSSRYLAPIYSLSQRLVTVCWSGILRTEVCSVSLTSSVPTSDFQTELESTISFGPNFSATSILHPATYLNKVVVASSQGDMQLWNIQTQFASIQCFGCFRTNACLRTLIHNFPPSRLLTSPETLASGSSERGRAITSVVQSPAIDVVGIGFTSGEISVYDIRADERLMRMFMEGRGIRALGFRSGLYSLPLVALAF